MTLREVIANRIKRIRKAKWNPLALLEIAYRGENVSFHFYWRGKRSPITNEDYKPQNINPETFNWDKDQWEEWHKSE